MAVNRDPVLKKCRSLGIDPLFLGIDKKSNKQPKTNPRKKVSEYGMQQKEKQKVKFYYNVLEKQFRKCFEEGARAAGATGENMLNLLEKRLDNVVFRMGIASTRRAARQIVNHGHITVNSKRVDIPSFRVKVGDVISIKENKTELQMFKDLKGMKLALPKWLEFNSELLSGKIIAEPTKEDIDLEIKENLIVEFYSR